MKKAIYTVITGDYDPIPPAPNFQGWDAILFSDVIVYDPNGWDVRMVGMSDNPVLQSRSIKILSHEHLPEYDLVCYIDAHQRLKIEPPACPIWFRHNIRKSIYQEARQLIMNGRFAERDVEEMICAYIDEGYKDCGLYINGFFVRDNKDESVNRLHDVWFEATKEFVPRDQMTLPYAIWKTGIEPMNIVKPQIRDKYVFIKHGHTQKYKRPPHNAWQE